MLGDQILFSYLKKIIGVDPASTLTLIVKILTVERPFFSTLYHFGEYIRGTRLHANIKPWSLNLSSVLLKILSIQQMIYPKWTLSLLPVQ